MFLVQASPDGCWPCDGCNTDCYYYQEDYYWWDPYGFSTSGHTVSYKLGKMSLPQLEAHGHGAEVIGLMSFDNSAS